MIDEIFIIYPINYLFIFYKYPYQYEFQIYF